MKIVFMGTPDFAVESLEALDAAGHEIALVISQEDKAKGRKAIVEKTPVKQAAERLGLPVQSVHRLRTDEDCIRRIREIAPDFIVVAAFGQILPKEVLDIPRFGAINIHASLLPKYRGASPIQQAVLDGEEESGITTMLMAEGLDTGDILLQEKLPLDRKETADSLFQKLAELSRTCIVKTLEGFSKGEIHPVAQENEKASLTGIIKKRDGFINWNREASYIERMVRAYTPWPNAVSILPNGKTFKIWQADAVNKPDEEMLSLGKIHRGDIEHFLGENFKEEYIPKEGAGGLFCSKNKQNLFFSTGKSFLEITELQVEGKKRMAAPDFLRGYSGKAE